MSTSWEPFETLHGVLALNYVLDSFDLQCYDRKEGNFFRRFSYGAKDFAGINYTGRHYVDLEKQYVENWFEILPFHAGSDTVVEDLTMKYKMTPLLSIRLRCGFTEEVRENINSDPVFVHQFGASGFTFINVWNRHLLNRVTTGVPDSAVREITFHQGDAFAGNIGGTVFFWVSPRWQDDLVAIPSRRMKLYDCYKVHAVIVSRFPESPATGSAATTLAAYLAHYISEDDIMHHDAIRRDLDPGDHRNSRFLIHMDTASTTKKSTKSNSGYI